MYVLVHLDFMKILGQAQKAGVNGIITRINVDLPLRGVRTNFLVGSNHSLKRTPVMQSRHGVSCLWRK